MLTAVIFGLDLVNLLTSNRKASLAHCTVCNVVYCSYCALLSTSWCSRVLTIIVAVFLTSPSYSGVLTTTVQCDHCTMFFFFVCIFFGQWGNVVMRGR